MDILARIAADLIERNSHDEELRIREERARTLIQLLSDVPWQARADGAISPEEEARAMAALLKSWALRSTVDASVVCASASRARTSAAAARPSALPINSSITRGG